MIYLRACARRRALRTRVSDRARGPLKRILDGGGGVYWIAIATKRTPGCFADLSDRYWIDVRLVFPCGVLSIASNERSAAAQRCRRRAGQPLLRTITACVDATAALGGSHCRMSSRPCLWLGAVQMDEQGLVCMRLEGNVRTGGNWHVVSHSHL